LKSQGLLFAMRQSIIVTKDVQTCDDILAKTVSDSAVVKYTSTILRRIAYWRLCLYTARISLRLNKIIPEKSQGNVKDDGTIKDSSRFLVSGAHYINFSIKLQL